MPQDSRRELVRELSSEACSQESDVRTILESYAAIVLKFIGDSFAVDLVEDDGTMRRAVTRHHDAAKQEALTEIRRIHPLTPTSAYGYPRVIKTGKSQFLPGVAPQLAHKLLPSDGQSIPDGIMVRSFICVPLVAHGRTLGALTVALTERTVPFSSDDLLLVEELAQTLADCLDTHLSPGA